MLSHKTPNKFNQHVNQATHTNIHQPKLCTNIINTYHNYTLHTCTKPNYQINRNNYPTMPPEYLTGKSALKTACSLGHNPPTKVTTYTSNTIKQHIYRYVPTYQHKCSINYITNHTSNLNCDPHHSSPAGSHNQQQINNTTALANNYRTLNRKITAQPKTLSNNRNIRHNKTHITNRSYPVCKYTIPQSATLTVKLSCIGKSKAYLLHNSLTSGITKPYIAIPGTMSKFVSKPNCKPLHHIETSNTTNTT
eukprot:gene3326-2308_t